MSRVRGSVRIGPVSLFSLVVILCLAVMAVLTLTTAQATYAAAEKQARFAADTYANERAAQNLVAEVDAALAPVRAGGGSRTEALAAVADALAQNGEAALDGNRVRATFETDSGRTLSVVLTVNDNATYTVSQWKATTQWNDTDSGEKLWSGAA